MKTNGTSTLGTHINEVKSGKRGFENAFQTVARMILEDSKAIEKIVVHSKSTYDYKLFRQGSKHVIGPPRGRVPDLVRLPWQPQNPSKEMAFVLVGEPGNGKTFFVDYLCALYRNFLARDENRRYTFNFTGLDKLATYGKISRIQSQTFEDPLILAMNLCETREESREYLVKNHGFKDKDIDKLYANYRPLGACSDYILNDIREFTGGDIKALLDFIEITPVPLSESLGTVTGKYSAKDKITSSAVDLLGEESIQRLLHISDQNNPYRFDLRRGALARVAGGGIHFSDEIFKNKKDLVQVYLGVIQNRNIEIDGFRWHPAYCRSCR